MNSMVIFHSFLHVYQRLPPWLRTPPRRLRNVLHIEATHFSFAAVLADRSVVTWGDHRSGGDSRRVQDQSLGAPFFGGRAKGRRREAQLRWFHNEKSWEDWWFKQQKVKDFTNLECDQRWSFHPSYNIYICGQSQSAPKPQKYTGNWTWIRKNTYYVYDCLCLPSGKWT